ncbi:hypothetical protein L6164_011074 [Bauhinia variegata]|uniref:Uncharacterized protein n=1 Tax=Bauhinia variegata TaxID=167791 RepID=A0ACB9P4R5_BAUVA|nr:hypothetical protein L6164_011074 [Bauhinia variegata]
MNTVNHKLNQRDRRFLSLPAVHPCEGVSPATLVTSLITLSQKICSFQSKLFPIQRRNARETIRQIGIILIFLEEIRERGLMIPDSVVLCFSELHVCFQKLHFLMEDCTRDGASLWMLMKSQLVAAQFRQLIRSVATALDVLPLHLIEVCGEVKELVELVAKQARKVKFEVDPDDERTSKMVHFVLSQFERGTEPDSNTMQQILDYLEIKSWADCNQEIRFLEDEISFQCSDCDERELPFLSDLLGFLNYCRGVIFKTLDLSIGNATDQSEGRCSTEIHTCINPEDFRCPISLELMTDPVTVSTGQTYDRASIQKWFKAGNMICPKTGEKPTSTDLVPNTTLKNLIQQFCADNGISLTKSGNQSRDISRTIVPGSPAAAQAMQFLSWFLARRLVFGTSEQQNKAAYEIRLLARSNIFNRACLIQVGTVSSLLNLLSTDDKSMQETAIAALVKLAKHNDGKEMIIESGGLTQVLIVLESGLSLEARQSAAAVVFYLCSVKENRKLIGENPKAIPALVELLKEGTTLGKKNAVVALFGLLLLPKNHQRVLAAGIVPALLDILATSEKADLVTDSLAVLAALAENVEGAYAILQASPLPLIVGILQTLTSRAGKEHCVSILHSLCVNVGAEVVGVLAKDPSLMPSLYSLVTDGTSHATKKARSLIKILLEFNQATSSRFMGSSVAQERSLHVW